MKNWETGSRKRP